MAAGDVRVLLNVDADDNVSAVIKQTNQVMRNFGRNSKQAGEEGSNALLKISGVMKNATTSFTELNAKVQLAKQAFSALQAIGERAISGEIANNAEKVFSQIAGGADRAAKVMDILRQTSKGLLDDTTLQQFAGGLKIAGVEFDQIQRIMAIATDVALATGQELEAVSNKIRDAALAGRQGEFDRLGVVVKVNEELKLRAESEGKLVDEMTKQEQVTTRLDILQEKLTQSMAAAGIQTSELSTNLRSLRTDLANLESTAEQTLANFLTPDQMQGMKDQMDELAENLFGRFSGELTDEAIRNSTYIQKRIGEITGLSQKEILETLDKISGFSKGWKGEHDSIINSLISSIGTYKQKRSQIEKDAAAESARLDAEANAEKIAKIREIEQENQDLQIALAELGKDGNAVERIQLNESLEMNKIYLKKLQGENQSTVSFLMNLTSLRFEGETNAAEKAEEERKKREKERSAAERKRRAEEYKKRLEEQRSLNQRLERLTLDADQTRLQMEIESARRAGDVQQAQLLERKQLQEKRSKEFLLTDMEHHQEMSAFRARFDKEEFDLAIRQNDELLQLQNERQSKSEELAREHADALKKIKEEELAAFQQQAERAAAALGMLQGPLVQLIDHEKGASDGLKVFGASMGATSEAANVYARETDASASATDRLVQGMPSMISAGGASAAAFVKQTKNKAFIQGGFEAASAIASFATGDVIGGAGHTAAAAAFFALAGKSSGKGSGGAGLGSTTGALKSGGGGSGMQAGSSGSSITVNVQGFALGSAVDMGAALGRTMDTARHTGLGTSEV